jgi:hypothetical protein
MNKPITDRTNKDWQVALNNAPTVKNNIPNLYEKKDTIDFGTWQRAIVDALTFLDNDYDLGMPGEDKEKQVYKDELITNIGKCPSYVCVSHLLKKGFRNKEILDKIMDAAYEKYNGNMQHSNDETTSAGSSGSFEGPLLGGKSKFKSNVVIKKKDLKQKIVESTTAAASGSYEQPEIWAKNRANWRGKIKTWKGGSFVHIKQKCKKYPYCNQDPGAIEITNVPLDKLDSIFETLSKETNKPYNVIKRMFFKHFDLK